MQQIKRSLFAMRNGVVADTLRRAGCPHKFIFGVNLPQLNEIAAQFGQSADLATALWADRNPRESRLLATLMMPAESVDEGLARKMADEVIWQEEADMLCFKLLRGKPFAASLAAELCADGRPPLQRYTGLRLYFNLVGTHAAEAAAAAKAELKRPDAIRGLAAMLAEEAAFILEG